MSSIIQQELASRGVAQVLVVLRDGAGAPAATAATAGTLTPCGAKWVAGFAKHFVTSKLSQGSSSALRRARVRMRRLGCATLVSDETRRTARGVLDRVESETGERIESWNAFPNPGSFVVPASRRVFEALLAQHEVASASANRRGTG